MDININNEKPKNKNENKSKNKETVGEQRQKKSSQKTQSNKKLRLIISSDGSSNRQVKIVDDEVEIIKDVENENEDDSELTKYEKKSKAYLESYNFIGYLKNRMDNDPKIKFDFNDAFNEVCGFAKRTVRIYDSWTRNHYETQVWQKYLELGLQQNHWVKEVVKKTKSREADINALFVKE